MLELEIVRKLRDACFELQHPVSLALDAFPVTLQTSLDQYMNKKLSDADLKAMVGFWPNGLWQEYLPLLQYCRASGVRLMACGTPPEVIVISLNKSRDLKSCQNQCLQRWWFVLFIT